MGRGVAARKRVYRQHRLRRFAVENYGRQNGFVGSSSERNHAGKRFQFRKSETAGKKRQGGGLERILPPVRRNFYGQALPFENYRRKNRTEFFPGGGRYFVYVGYRYRDGKRLRRRGKNRGCVYGLHIAYRRYPGVSRLFVRLSHPEIFVGKNEKCFGHRQSGRGKIARLSACGNQSRRRVRVVRTENAYGILLRNRNLPQRERNLLHACFFERR